MKQKVRASAGTILLPNWLRWLIYILTAILGLTGIIWLISHYTSPHNDDIPQPIQAWMMKLHGLAVMPALFVYGSLLRSHMIKAWNGKMNRNTGLISVSILALLTISGYMLYYIADEKLRSYTSLAHWIIGLCLLLALPLHIITGRKKITPKKAPRKNGKSR